MKEEIVNDGILKGIKISNGQFSVYQYADASCGFDLYKARLKARNLYNHISLHQHLFK